MRRYTALFGLAVTALFVLLAALALAPTASAVAPTQSAPVALVSVAEPTAQPVTGCTKYSERQSDSSRRFSTGEIVSTTTQSQVGNEWVTGFVLLNGKPGKTYTMTVELDRCPRGRPNAYPNDVCLPSEAGAITLTKSIPVVADSLGKATYGFTWTVSCCERRQADILDVNGAEVRSQFFTRQDWGPECEATSPTPTRTATPKPTKYTMYFPIVQVQPEAAKCSTRSMNVVYGNWTGTMAFSPWPGSVHSNILLEYGRPIVFSMGDGRPVDGSYLGWSEYYSRTGSGPFWSFVAPNSSGDVPYPGRLYWFSAWYTDRGTLCSLSIPLQWDPPESGPNASATLDTQPQIWQLNPTTGEYLPR